MNANGTIKSSFNVQSVDTTYHVEQVSDSIAMAMPISSGAAPAG